MNKLIVLLTCFSFLQSCINYSALPLPHRKTKGIYHTVKKGRTLWRICKRYDVNLQDIAEINNIKKVSQIKAGDKIFIPDADKRLYVPPAKKHKVTKPSKKTGEIKKNTGMFVWPVKGRVIRKFGIYKGMKYDGINIKAPLKSAVKASYGGKVVFSSFINGYGNTIIIQHKYNYATVYANNNVNLVKKGQWIKQGHKIARVGTSKGTSKTPYLHFQIRKKNIPRNPAFYLH